MHIRELHGWEVSPAEAVRIQYELMGQICLQALEQPPHLAAGADVSYQRGSSRFYGGVVVVELPQLQTVEEAVAVGEMAFPYISGLLSFREAPVLLQAFQKLTITPDVVIVDGQGIAHPRRMGIASHIGLWLDCPSIGCAKSKLYGVYDDKNLGEAAGSVVSLRTQTNKEIGKVVRTKKRTKPVFVSPGYKIDVVSSLNVVLQCCHGYKLPEPTRLAHHLVNRVRCLAM